MRAPLSRARCSSDSNPSLLLIRAGRVRMASGSTSRRLESTLHRIGTHEINAAQLSALPTKRLCYCYRSSRFLDWGGINLRWVGIDEAGYGPNLGPMVMTAVVDEGPVGRTPDLWRHLAGTGARAGGG